VQRKDECGAWVELICDEVHGLDSRLLRDRDEVKPTDDHVYRPIVLLRSVKQDVADPGVGAADVNRQRTLFFKEEAHDEKTTRPLPFTSTTTYRSSVMSWHQLSEWFTKESSITRLIGEPATFAMFVHHPGHRAW
jgi:hypothetical protein